MTLQEFKAWFDGFTENIEKIPSQKQWKRIQERVAEIDGITVTERVYVDRYLQPYRWPGIYQPIWMSGVAASNTGTGMSSTTVSGDTVSMLFNSVDAMSNAGRAEAHQLLAGPQ